MCAIERGARAWGRGLDQSEWSSLKPRSPPHRAKSILLERCAKMALPDIERPLKQKPKSVSGSDPSKKASPKIPLDHILFRGGTDLTAFQSIGLVLIGLAFVFLIGLPLLAYGLRLDRRDIRALLAGGTLALWGLVMIANGITAFATYCKRNRTKPK